MAHFAKIDDTNTVQEVIVIANDAINGGNFPESEPIGQAFIASLGFDGTWLQCSYHGNFRFAYPGIGWTYDAANDIFVAPPPTIDVEE
jgi:hypothetical protein